MSLWDDPLATESIEANEVKKNEGISVVIGNPPYSNSSINQNQWILDLINVYKEGLNEKNLNLDEDSIKFIRYGQYLIDKNGEGILAYISNNSFLNGVTHRKMRQELITSFNLIYVLNLHGDSNRLEKCTDGSKDENVFDIKQGVSIHIFVKSSSQNNETCKVYYKDLYGLKYAYLSEKIGDIVWENIHPQMPFFFLTIKTTQNQKDMMLDFREQICLVRRIQAYKPKMMS